MKLKLRVRVNDVANIVSRGEFIHFDNCVNVEIGKPEYASYDDVKECRSVYLSIMNPYGKFNPNCPIIQRNPNNNKPFDEVHYMLRDQFTTKQRIEKEIAENKLIEKTPFHFNVITWKDRVTGEWHILLFDTVCFLQNDQGDTLEKIQG